MVKNLSQEIIEFFSLKNFEKSRSFNYEYTPNRLSKALKDLGDVHKKMEIIHVAGTNGKGSFCRYYFEMLKLQNVNCGLYTSPHYEILNERIENNEGIISNEDLNDVWFSIKPLCEKYELSFFDGLTLAAVVFFAKKKVTTAVFETGLGGRLDSTNCLAAQIAVITRIGLDHQQILGDTIEKISFEKAGIFKENKQAFVILQDKTILDTLLGVANKKNTQLKIIETKEVEGEPYYIQNMKFAIEVFKQVENRKVSREVLFQFLININLVGRLEVFNSSMNLLFDSAHNIMAMNALAKIIVSSNLNLRNFNKHTYLWLTNQKPINIVFAMQKKKDFLPLFESFFTLIFTLGKGYLINDVYLLGCEHELLRDNLDWELEKENLTLLLSNIAIKEKRIPKIKMIKTDNLIDFMSKLNDKWLACGSIFAYSEIKNSLNNEKYIDK